VLFEKSLDHWKRDIKLPKSIFCSHLIISSLRLLLYPLLLLIHSLNIFKFLYAQCFVSINILAEVISISIIFFILIELIIRVCTLIIILASVIGSSIYLLIGIYIKSLLICYVICWYVQPFSVWTISNILIAIRALFIRRWILIGALRSRWPRDVISHWLWF
jgi:hypothetical protein